MKELKKHTIDVTGLTILDHNGDQRIPLNGVYYANFFAYRLIDEWLGYTECHNCGRFDYCKYVQRKPGSKTRAEDIKCGVVSDVIMNFILYTSKLYATLTFEQKQDYLDGLFYLQKFIYRTELMTGLLMSKDFLQGFGAQDSPGIFGDLVKTRITLDAIAHKFMSIPKLSTVQCYLLVEGQSEKVFVEQLVKGGLMAFYNINVESYKGKDNKRYKKIHLLIEDYYKKGYKIYMQGDADGRNGNIFQDHIQKGTLQAENVFQFKYDFESAIPRPLFYDCLRELGYLKRVSLKRFITALEGKNGSMLKEEIKNEFKVDLDNFKIPLAITCAELMYRHPPFWFWKNFYETELGTFVKFLEKIDA